MSANLAVLMRPKKLNAVRLLVQEAKIDVSHWERRKDGQLVENPNNNISQNTQWSFGGNGEPTAIFLWFRESDWLTDPPQHSGNTKVMQDTWNALADRATDGTVKKTLRKKIVQASQLQESIRVARSKRLPLRVVWVDGKQVELDEAGNDSSSVAARELDPEDWYAHEFDPYTGDYRLVRGVQPPQVTVVDPYADIADPGLDPAFLEFIEDLPETEREALIKARVGQGSFKKALIERWGGCSVTGFSKLDVLIASHIQPWSKCTTPAQRLGAANGLLLIPNFDKLFDRGYITFDERFKVRVSPQLSRGHAIQLGVNTDMRLGPKAEKDMLPFLEYHRANVFRP